MLIIDIEPVFAAEAEFERGVARFDERFRRGHRQAVEEAAREALNTRHYQDQTGLLTSRIKGFVELSVPGAALGWVGAYTDYASFVNDGTRPHEIRPRLAAGFVGPARQGQGRRTRAEGPGSGYLTFKTRDGQWVTTKLVHHPGTKGDGFMSRAFAKCERVLLRETEIAAAELQRYLEG